MTTGQVTIKASSPCDLLRFSNLSQRTRQESDMQDKVMQVGPSKPFRSMESTHYPSQTPAPDDTATSVMLPPRPAPMAPLASFKNSSRTDKARHLTSQLTALSAARALKRSSTMPSALSRRMRSETKDGSSVLSSHCKVFDCSTDSSL